MIPARFGAILFELILSCTMSLIISGVSTLRAAGPGEGFLSLWRAAWLSSWIIAFPAVLLVGPLARWAVRQLVR